MRRAWIGTWPQAALIAVALGCASGAEATTTQYFYDAAGRLSGLTANATQIKSYTYDNADNRSQFQFTPPTQPASGQRLAAGEYLFQGQALVAADGGHVLTLQEDGNLVLYNTTAPIWSANTSAGLSPTASMGAYLTMQSGGNLVLYTLQNAVVWNSGTNGNNGAYAIVQTNGNVVIYSASGAVLWQTGTTGK